MNKNAVTNRAMSSYQQGLVDGLESFAEALESALVSFDREQYDVKTVVYIANLARAAARKHGRPPR